MKTSILKPNMTSPTVPSTSTPRKPFAVPALPGPLPPRQPLPSASIDRSKPMLKLGLDVHLEFIVAVVQRGHLSPHAPRKFTSWCLTTHPSTFGAAALARQTLSSCPGDEHLSEREEKGKALLEKGNAVEQSAGEL